MLKIKKWVDTYGVQATIKRGFYSLSPWLPVDYNHSFRKQIWYSHYKKCIKKYLVIHKDCKDRDSVNMNVNLKIIWWCWLQGVENAPKMVQRCYKSVTCYAAEMGYQVVCLSSKNLHDYIHLPDKIMKKWKAGYISSAMFSDLCRLCLLASYGGVWIDSTVLLTGKIEEEILDADLFFYKAAYMSVSVTKMSNWFIVAKKPGNAFILSLKDSLINYWENNNKPGDYFLMHIMITALSESEALCKMYHEIPFYCNSYPKLMERVLLKEYDNKIFMHILKNSTIHKLTYKNMENLPKNSVGRYIIDHDYIRLT